MRETTALSASATLLAGMTLTEADGMLLPIALVATTVHEYAPPLVSGATTIGANAADTDTVAGPVQVAE